MADFDLTQTDAQVQSILNDAQDAQGAGAQTTLTTDYIMLKGTNGRYHKIQKDSFTEAVRNVLAGLLVNNDKGTTISQIAAIASGDFGSITPANLASVLGAATIITNQNDLNNIVSAGVYAWSGSGTAPLNNFRPQGSLLLVWRALAQIFQLQWPNNIEGSGLGFRVMWNNEWKPWYKVEVTLGQ
jgi:hypothetical protein